MDQDQASAPLCTVCGTRLNSSDRYCPNCGTPNPSYSPTTPDQQTERLSPPPGSLPADQGYTPTPPAAATSWPPPPEPRQQGGNRNTWLIIGGIALAFILLCCCCVLLVAVASSSDSAFQEELEGTARLALSVF